MCGDNKFFYSPGFLLFVPIVYSGLVFSITLVPVAFLLLYLDVGCLSGRFGGVDYARTCSGSLCLFLFLSACVC